MKTNFKIIIMEKLETAIPVFLLLLFMNSISRKWYKQYEEKNPIEHKKNETRTYSKFFYTFSKRIYFGTKILLGILILKIIYMVLVHCF